MVGIGQNPGIGKRPKAEYRAILVLYTYFLGTIVAHFEPKILENGQQEPTPQTHIKC
jgi:hypothetical protein